MKDADLALKGLTVWGWGAGRLVIPALWGVGWAQGVLVLPGEAPTASPDFIEDAAWTVEDSQ